MHRHGLTKGQCLEVFQVLTPVNPDSPYQVQECWLDIVESALTSAHPQVLSELTPPTNPGVSTQDYITSTEPGTAGDPPEVIESTPQVSSTSPPSPIVRPRPVEMVSCATQTDLSGPVIEVPEVHIDISVSSIRSSTAAGPSTSTDPIWDLPTEDIFTHYHFKQN